MISAESEHRVNIISSSRPSSNHDRKTTSTKANQCISTIHMKNGQSQQVRFMHDCESANPSEITYLLGQESNIPMKSKKSVIGIVKARNEWPLLGLCIIHSLENHVDDILVINHASSDETGNGIAELQKSYGSRVQVLHLDKGPLQEQALYLLLSKLIDRDKYEWIYHVDADEFLVTSNGQRLSSLLSDIPASVDVVRYEVLNFVAPIDFQESDLDRYQELTYRSVVERGYPKDVERTIEDIESLTSTFFALEFPSKVVYRTRSKFWAIAGSHAHIGYNPSDEHTFDTEAVFAAHLPFLTRDRLLRRAVHGKDLREAGYPKTFGWQSQIVDRMRERDKLEDFWAIHSINERSNQIPQDLPKVVNDQRLVRLFDSTVNKFKDVFDSTKANEFTAVKDFTDSVPLAIAVNSIQALTDFTDVLMKEQTDQLQAANTQLQAANTQLQTANTQLQTANTQLQTAMGKTSSLQAEVADLSQQMIRIHSSLSWRITAPVRSLHRLIKRSKDR